MLGLIPNYITEPEGYEFPVFLLGAGAAAPTLVGRDNVSLARTAAGKYTITFNDDPGNFLGGTFGFQDTVLGASAGYDVVFGPFTPPANGSLATLTFQTSNAAQAATDLAATQNLKLHLEFKRADLEL